MNKIWFTKYDLVKMNKLLQLNKYDLIEEIHINTIQN